MIPENFLHYLWQLKRFDLNNLTTTEGDAILLLDIGEHNADAGPDFLNARLKIGDTVWAGNVEMHVKASDWYKHQHETDKGYNNVILHVVFDDDVVVKTESEQTIPTLSLRNRIPLKLLNKYQQLIQNENWIPCEKQFSTISEFTRNIWLDRLLIERLEQKTAYIAELLETNINNWEVTFYQFVARSFGVKVNAEPFELLAKSLPLLTLAKHKNNRFQLEALLFGQAGLLEKELKDDYPNRLKKEYRFLQKKYNLKPIPPTVWKFLRLRPANFPTIRIAQFATLIHQSSSLFSKVLEAKNVKTIEELFKVQLSDYWLTHYVFDKESKQRNKSLGKTAIHLLIINTIVPFLFYYGTFKKEEPYKDRAFQILETLKPEKNKVITGWKNLGVEVTSSYQTQPLLQLKKHYCDQKRCLNCSIGNAILKG